MPGKDRRVAARQAQLRQRRKRQNRGPSSIPSVAPSPATVRSQTPGGVATETPGPPSSALSAPSNSRPRTEGPLRNPGRTRGEQSIAYTYVGPELRRILILSSVILAILIVLGILLR